ncbi:IclR family transcriptional regulator [Arthrobacter castelli]|uniref:IclR family transcriptional regulator n=1 Tax=Arthrobacter castelli TaxID=271431 RepID=UPI0003F81CDA|nr:IclR family transcriptional regulator [Arthrobacter castelli]
MASDTRIPAGTEHNPEQGGASSGPGVQSVDRAITVLEILSRTGGSFVGELAEAMGVHKSTASRLISALERRGMVQQTDERGKYQLGFGILRMAAAIPGRLSLVQEARPILQALADEFGETTNLAVLRSNVAVNVDQAMGPSAVATHDWIGNLTPLHATASGKIFLAHLDAEGRDKVLKATGQPPRTSKTITSRAALDQELERVLETGYSAVYEELEIGLNAVAVPIWDYQGDVVGSISMSGPAFRFRSDEIAALCDELVHAGNQVSAHLGYTG